MRNRLTHAQSGDVLADKVIWASSWSSRARGLIGRSLLPTTALVLQPGKQVHTFFMSRPIDVIFCDTEWIVLHVVYSMIPWRVSRWVRGARYIVELAAGRASNVKAGDRLEV